MTDHAIALTRVLDGASERIQGHISEARRSYLQLLADIEGDGEYEFVWDEVCAIETAVLQAEFAIEAIRLICPANLDLEADSKKLAERLAIVLGSVRSTVASWAEKRPNYEGEGVWSVFSVIRNIGNAKSLAEATYRFLVSIPSETRSKNA